MSDTTETTSEPTTFADIDESEFWRACVLALMGNPNIKGMLGPGVRITDLADTALRAYQKRANHDHG